MLTIHRFQKDGATLSKLKPLLATVFIATSVLFIDTTATPHQHPLWQIFSVLSIAIAGLVIQALVIGYPSAFAASPDRIPTTTDEPRALGLLSLSRTPLDFGEFLAWFSIVILTGSPALGVLYVLGFILCYERILIYREKLLALKHGDRFHSWIGRTPILFAKRTVWSKPPNTFNWRRVALAFKLRFTGLSLAIAAIFIRHCVLNGPLPLRGVPGFWIVAAAGLCITWAVLAPTQTAIKFWEKMKSVFQSRD